MAAAQPIRDKQNVRKMAQFYLDRGQVRNFLLVIMGVNTALRISDLLRLRWIDVFDFDSGRFRQHVSIIEHKTGKRKTLALNRDILRALKRYATCSDTRSPGAFLFQSNRKNRAAISRIQAYRILRQAAEHLHLRERVSCHSLRKTFGYHAWKSGTPIVVIMDIYNHSSYSVTKRYLGVSQDDRDCVYRDMSFA